MYPSYSIKKGVGKAVVFMLQASAAVAVVAGVSDISLWGLIEQYLKPIVGALSVGGALALATNYVKYNWL